MSVLTVISFYVGGIVGSGLTFKFLQRRFAETTAFGLSSGLLAIGLYPTMLWVTGKPHQFTTSAIYAAFGVLGAVASAKIYGLLHNNEPR
jgi:hypothetical protein